MLRATRPGAGRICQRINLGGHMRRFIAAASAAGIGFAFTAAYAVAASASVIQSHVIVVSPGHSIQAAVDHAHPGDTILLKAGVFHQSVQIRTDRITLRGSGDSRSGTVLEPTPGTLGVCGVPGCYR